ncbi:hypothetical protein CCZ00_25300 [Pseudomonas savastanoi pv. fraxini]|nr:hypothetical protein CCZ00_25300 [Pseudomonas savastanoi pv. fraxini]
MVTRIGTRARTRRTGCFWAEALDTPVPHAPRHKRTQSVPNGMRRRASHDSGNVIPDDPRSSRSSVGMQFKTLCVARGRGASRPACPRGARAR